MSENKKVICGCCGAVIEVGNDVEGDDWLPCIFPTGFEWRLPSGKIIPIIGDPFYVDAMGVQMSKEDYISKYNVDPEIAYNKMRGWFVNQNSIRTLKPAVKIGLIGRQ